MTNTSALSKFAQNGNHTNGHTSSSVTTNSNPSRGILTLIPELEQEPLYSKSIEVINNIWPLARKFNEAQVQKTVDDANTRKDYNTLVRICALIIVAKVKWDDVKLIYQNWTSIGLEYADILIVQSIFASRSLVTKPKLVEFVKENYEQSPRILAHLICYPWGEEFFPKIIDFVSNLVAQKKVNDSFVDKISEAIGLGNKIDFGKFNLLIQGFAEANVSENYLFKLGRAILSTNTMYLPDELYSFVEKYLPKESKLTVFALDYHWNESEMKKIIPWIAVTDDERSKIGPLIIARKIKHDDLLEVVEKYIAVARTDDEAQKIVFEFAEYYIAAQTNYTSQQFAEFLKKFGRTFPALIQYYTEVYPFNPNEITQIYEVLPQKDQDTMLWGNVAEIRVDD